MQTLLSLLQYLLGWYHVLRGRMPDGSPFALLHRVDIQPDAELTTDLIDYQSAIYDASRSLLVGTITFDTRWLTRYTARVAEETRRRQWAQSVIVRTYDLMMTALIPKARFEAIVFYGPDDGLYRLASYQDHVHGREHFEAYVTFIREMKLAGWLPAELSDRGVEWLAPNSVVLADKLTGRSVEEHPYVVEQARRAFTADLEDSLLRLRLVDWPRRAFATDPELIDEFEADPVGVLQLVRSLRVSDEQVAFVREMGHSYRSPYETVEEYQQKWLTRYAETFGADADDAETAVSEHDLLRRLFAQ